MRIDYFNKPIIIISLLFTSLLVGQEKKLSFDQVFMFAEPRILSPAPRLLGWYDDENYLLQKKDSKQSAIVKVNALSGEENVILNFSEINDSLPKGFSAEKNIGISGDYKKLIFTNENNLFYYDIARRNLIQLTFDESEEKNATFSPGGNKIAYTKNNDLYVYDLQTNKELRLTFDATEVVYNGYDSWVYMEEIHGRGSNYKAFWWSPNSEMIAFLQTDESLVPKFPLFSMDGTHGAIEWMHYPKPGDNNPIVKLGVIHLTDQTIVWIEEDETIDQYTAWPFWTPNSEQLFYQVLNRGQDHLQILSTNPTTGKNKIIYEEKQSSWVEFFEDIYFFNDMSGFILRSDVDGWRHIYHYDINGKLKKKLTDGEWTVKKIVRVDETNKKVYFEADKDNSFDNYLFVVNLDGSNLTKLTKESGTHSTSVSNSGSSYYSTYSNINSPPVIELFDSKGKSIKLLADRKSEIFDDYVLGKSELFKITASDGTELPAMWVLPPDFDEKKKYPVILSVYGGPGRNDISNSFFAYLERYFISQSGIIHFVVDHRGSEHFGKQGTSLMHRNLGKWEMNDYIEAARWLRTKPFVDSTKIGISGGSYGGYVTCMAITYGSDYFTHGVADYSVTDWQLYDNVYTERFMDTPKENPDGYKFGSALTHTDKYKGKLLIRHGSLDDNVHMQNTFNFIDKLILLKKDFELMIYPNERHGVGFGKRSKAMQEYMSFWFRNFFGIGFFIE